MKAWVIAALAAFGVLGLVSCDNSPVASRVPLPMLADFRALHLVDNRYDPPRVLDTAFVQILGGDGIQSLDVKVNGVAMPLAAIYSGSVIYSANVPVEAGGAMRFDVASTWRNASNEMLVPSYQPVLTSPRPDSVYSRTSAIPIEWSGRSDEEGELYIDLAHGDQPGALSDTLWTALPAVSDGMIDIPASIWAENDDTTAILTIWRMSTHVGDGFEGGVFMVAGLGVRQMIRISPPDTGTVQSPERFARR